jgi:hypothetical protein
MTKQTDVLLEQGDLLERTHKVSALIGSFLLSLSLKRLD